MYFLLALLNSVVFTIYMYFGLKNCEHLIYKSSATFRGYNRATDKGKAFTRFLHSSQHLYLKLLWKILLNIVRNVVHYVLTAA